MCGMLCDVCMCMCMSISMNMLDVSTRIVQYSRRSYSLCVGAIVVSLRLRACCAHRVVQGFSVFNGKHLDGRRGSLDGRRGPSRRPSGAARRPSGSRPTAVGEHPDGRRARSTSTRRRRRDAPTAPSRFFHRVWFCSRRDSLPLPAPFCAPNELCAGLTHPLRPQPSLHSPRSVLVGARTYIFIGLGAAASYCRYKT